MQSSAEEIDWFLKFINVLYVSPSLWETSEQLKHPAVYAHMIQMAWAEKNQALKDL